MWSLYCDLTLNFGKHKEIKSVYMRMIELKVISPKGLLNYAYYLLKKNSYEEAFRVFERGLNIFKWPSLYAIWINYLVQLELRFKDKKVERLRDLYERVLLDAPDKYSKPAD